MTVVPPDSGFYVEERSMVSDADIEKLSVSRTARGLAIDIFLTHEAASRLSEATTENVGGLIAVLLNGRFVEISRIVEPLAVPPEDRLRVGIDLEDHAAERMAAAMAARWPQ